MNPDSFSHKSFTKKLGSSLHARFFKISPLIRMNILAGIVGLMGGLGAWIFRQAIELVYNIFFIIPSQFLTLVGIPGLSWIFFLISPAIGGFLVGIITSRAARETRGDGVPELLEIIAIKEGRMTAKIPFFKIIASSITIGSGGSAGREAPVFQIGGGFASVIGQQLKLSPRELRTLVISGVGSGISAIFNAPLGGALFAMESLMREGAITALLIPIIVASVVGTVIGQALLGTSPAFLGFPTIANIEPFLIPLIIILGLITGLLSAFWIKFFYKFEDTFEHISKNFSIPEVVQPAVGGLAVGIILTITFFYTGNDWQDYTVMGNTYAPMEAIFSGSILEGNIIHIFIILIMLFLIKMVATVLTINTGGSGGAFAPTLFLGSMLGALFGICVNLIFGGPLVYIQLFSLLGMAAFFAGTIRVPLTAIVMTAEMVNDYFLMIPLMFVVAFSWLLSSFLESNDIYILKLIRRGTKIGDSRIDILRTIKVSEAMIPKDKLKTVDVKTRLEEVLDLMRKTRFEGFPVFDGENFVGIITLSDIERGIQENPKDWIVIDVLKNKTRSMICIDSEATLAHAIAIMTRNDISRLPVVESSKSSQPKLLGWLTARDINRTYAQKEILLSLEEIEDHMVSYPLKQEI